MATTSSLLKSAAAAKKKVQTQQDALVAFDWENSAQTYDDFLQYSSYLQDRSDKTSDASDQLSYQTKLRSARRSYTSNELQRQQMSIMEGAATTTDKLSAIQGLYGQAVDNGDLNLAQNLYSQWDALTIKLQNEQDAAAKSFAAAGSKAFTDMTNDLTKGFDDVTLPSGETVTPLPELKRLFEQDGDVLRVAKSAQETLEALKNVTIDQYNAATTQEEVDKLEQQYGPGLADIDKKLTLNVGGKTLTAQDVVNVIANDQLNNPTYGLQVTHNETTGANEYKLKDNNVERLDYARQIDPKTGEEYYVPVTVRTDQNSLKFGTSNQGRGIDTLLTDEGAVIGSKGEIMAGEGNVNRDSNKSIKNRLQELGYTVDQSANDGTTIRIKLPGENVERSATIQPDGSIRYFGDDGNIMEVGLTKRNLGTDSLPQIYEAGQTRIVAPDEISDFGANSAFGGRLSQTSNQGQRYIDSITGKTRSNTPLLGNNRILVGNNFSGYGGAATSGSLQGTSAILQSAGLTQKAIQQEQARQTMLQAQAEAAARLQATPTFDLNQTPVQQLASNGVLKKQLQVAAPQPQQRITVANAPTQNITSVGVAQPTNRISGVGVASAPRLTVR